MPTLDLQPASDDGQDTYLNSHNTTRNYGTDQTIWCGGSGASASTITRGLIRFDLSDLDGMSITSATLSVRAVEGADATLSIYRALTQWYEGSQNDATPDSGQNGSTWDLRNHNGSVAWAGGAGGAAGSDWASTATDSTTSVSNVFSMDVTDDVQAFADGTATNYGWWLRVPAWETIDWNVCRLYSSDAGTASYRPRLVVEYTESDGASIIPHAMHYAQLRRSA